jgi:hypothetical protein
MGKLVPLRPGVAPDENGKQRFAVEGLKDQRILYAISADSGETWSEPKAGVSTRCPRGVYASVRVESS